MRSLRSRRAAQDTDHALATVRAARSSGLCTLPGLLGSHTAAMRGRCVQALAAAAASADAGVRAVALTHPLCHPAWRRRLRSDPDVSLRWAAPVAAAAEMMASDHCVTVRDAVARSEHCPAGVLRRLSFSSDAYVVESVAQNPATPIEVLTRLGVGDVALRRQVAQNPSAAAQTLLVLAEDPDDRIREYVAHNPSTPPDVLASLALDDEYQVQMGVAANTRTPPATLMKLAVDAIATDVLASNPSTPRDALEGIALGRCMHDEPCRANDCQWDEIEREDVLAGVLANPSTAADLLEYLYDAPEREHDTPFAIARAETHAELLAEWATHEDEYVRREVARNPHTSAITLAVLASDTGDGIQNVVAANANCPPATLTELAQANLYASSVAANPSCAPDTLRDLARVSTLEHMIACNPSCPSDLLESLAVSGSSDTRAAVIVNDACSDALAASLAAADPDSMVRAAYAIRALDQFGASAA